jgi:hypothetical protein
VPSALRRIVSSGIVPVVGDVLVEFPEFVVGDLGGGPGPDGLHGVEGLVLDDFFRFAPFLHVAFVVAFVFGPLDFHADGVRDEIGVFLDDLADFPGFGVFDQFVLVALFLFQMEGDGGAGGVAVGFLEGVGAVAFGFPAGGFLFAGAAGEEGHAVGDHEGGVEADAELADEFGRDGVLFEFLPLAEELLGAGAGDGADVLDDLVAAHADAGVVDGDGPGRFVGFDADVGVIGLGEV